MAKATMSPGQLATFRAARHLDDATRKAVAAQVFAGAKRQFGIPEKHRIKVECDDVASPMLGVIVRKKTGATYDVGPAVHVTQHRWFVADMNDNANIIVGDNDFTEGSVIPPVGVVTLIDGFATVVTNGVLSVQMSDAQFAARR